MLKKQHEGTLLLMRIGNHCHLFDEDAEKASLICGLDSFPFFDHACSFRNLYLDSYLSELTRMGHRVAVYDFAEEKRTRCAY